jgi:hypothetical protein
LSYTLAHADDNIDKVVEHLGKESLALIEWFSCNQMKANPDKFQALAIGKKSMDKNIAFDLAGNKIKCEKEVKFLGVTIICICESVVVCIVIKCAACGKMKNVV